MNFTKASLAGNVTGWKALNLVMKANVLGIVITALAGLVAFLTRTQEGIDWVSAKTKVVVDGSRQLNCF
ncbi:hypothetical protein [Rufibacter hautae]|uniref:Uncharacterized protein n=1 Tax=Rufibacter hautae TaxID=2595005 RepID=A0A5B6TEA6_9BACT|nr:hypothetical protein [Rufibacter hautae]KAA3438478.1 hypothetical protein FOA19_14685 [Rufibacter hautae]